MLLRTSRAVPAPHTTRAHRAIANARSFDGPRGLLLLTPARGLGADFSGFSFVVPSAGASSAASGISRMRVSSASNAAAMIS